MNRTLRSIAIGSVAAGVAACPAPAKRLASGIASQPSAVESHRDSATLSRWRVGYGAPVRVWIQQATDIPEWQATFADEVRYAFAAWSRLLPELQFYLVADSTEADIRVAWVDRFSAPITGQTHWRSNEELHIADAWVVLAVRRHDGTQLDDDATYSLALHEIGHAIGLDHALDAASVMAPLVRVRDLSPSDREAALRLYRRPAGD